MPISAADIQQIASKEDDFGHEMRVGSVIRSTLPKCSHAGTYTDPVSRKPRQFDYRCSIRDQANQVMLAVECKNLNPSCPLVVCGAAREKGESFHEIIQTHGPGQGILMNGAWVQGPLSQTMRTWGNQYYREGKFVGKSLLRLKLDQKQKLQRVPDEDVYERWAQAISSAVGVANSVCDDAFHFQESIASAVLPVVVVPDDSLWIVWYAGNGALEQAPEQVAECEFYVERGVKVGASPKPHRFTFSHIHFFTLAGFSAFTSELARPERSVIWERLFDPARRPAPYQYE